MDVPSRIYLVVDEDGEPCSQVITDWSEALQIARQHVTEVVNDGKGTILVKGIVGKRTVVQYDRKVEK